MIEGDRLSNWQNEDSLGIRIQPSTGSENRGRSVALRVLSSAADLEAALRESHERPVLLFKHSRNCGLSHMALERLREHVRINQVPISYIITVQPHRNLCADMTRMLGVRHETPQAILVDAGKAVWHRTHHHITAKALVAAATLVRLQLDAPALATSGTAPDEPATEEFLGGLADRDGSVRCLPGTDGGATRGEDQPDDDDDDDDDEAPETPTDEPSPTPVQDPPDEPDKGPYTVSPQHGASADCEMGSPCRSR